MSEPSTRKEMRDPRSLWSWLRVFLVLHIITTVVLSLSGAWFTIIGGDDPDFMPRDLNETAVSLGYFGASIVTLIIFVMCIVLTCRVTFRMMKNLHIAGSSYASISPGWAVGSYFVPFINLVVPPKAVGEIWRGTFAETEGVPPREPAGAIGWWWMFWIIGNILDNVGARMQGTSMLGQQSAVPHDQVMGGVIVLSIASACTVLAAIFMLALFAKLVRAQSQMVSAAAMA